MPKKSASARNGAQRNKPKVQKNIELVRPTNASEESALESADDSDTTDAVAVATRVDTMVAPKAKSAGSTRRRSISPSQVRESADLVVAGPTVEKEEQDEEEQAETRSVVPAATTAPKSASARLAARRQSGQKNQRTAVSLITAEHYSYVRKDLAFIAVLALIMFAAIIVLHFVPGIGY
ncbi:MAG TPA: hypothetical protein VKR42_05830 [Ktedonobacteraceae bacterium]|nr:hypothetical protein [Ktedonobacteraceae bacterium]